VYAITVSTVPGDGDPPPATTAASAVSWSNSPPNPECRPVPYGKYDHASKRCVAGK
jgi:hypothetical protein